MGELHGGEESERWEYCICLLHDVDGIKSNDRWREERVGGAEIYHA